MEILLLNTHNTPSLGVLTTKNTKNTKNAKIEWDVASPIYVLFVVIMRSISLSQPLLHRFKAVS